MGGDNRRGPRAAPTPSAPPTGRVMQIGRGRGVAAPPPSRGRWVGHDPEGGLRQTPTAFLRTDCLERPPSGLRPPPPRGGRGDHRLSQPICIKRNGGRGISLAAHRLALSKGGYAVTGWPAKWQAARWPWG